MPIVVIYGPEDADEQVHYASIADVRAADGSLSATDAEIEASLTFVDALIDGRARRTFRKSTLQKVFDVRTDTVVLDLMGTITEVRIGALVIPPESYEVFEHGIRFYSPPGGVWRHPSRPLTVEPITSWWRSGRGVTVELAGDFGDDVPVLINRAAVELALEDLRGGVGSSSVIPEVRDDVSSFSVEGLSVSFVGSTGGNAPRLSTGNGRADRYIDLAAPPRAAFVV